MAYQDMHHPRENYPADRPRDFAELRYYVLLWLRHVLTSNWFLYGVMIGQLLVMFLTLLLVWH
jgi:hypothetical protein